MAIKQIVATLPYQDPAGNLLASGMLTFDLSQTATATGSGEVAPLRVSITLNSSGTFSATNFWANDQLQPTGTTYHVRAYNSNGLLAADFGNYQITGTSPIDISGIVPSSTNPTTAVTALSLNSLALGGETFTASPRGLFCGYIAAGNRAANTYFRIILDKAITVTRVFINAATSESGVGTHAVIRVTDGATNIDTALANGTQTYDSGALTQNYAAAANLDIRIATASVGGTPASDIGVVVEYRMQ